MIAQPQLSVLEFTDPACPWAWGSEPKVRWLRTALGEQVAWRRVWGILFDPQDDDPAPDPDAEAVWYQGFVDGVARHTGAPAAPRLEWVCLSSWPASLAATAAARQGEAVAERVVRRLREQTFVHGRPADTDDRVLAALATGAGTGLDLDRLAAEMALPEVFEQVAADKALTRRPDPLVCGLSGDGPHTGAAKELPAGRRYALPTLIFEGPAGRAIVPGWRPLAEYVDAVLTVAPEYALAAVEGPAAAVLKRWHTLSAPDLSLLTVDKRPPAAAFELRLRHGSLWVEPGQGNLDKVYRQLTDSSPDDMVGA